MSMVDFKDLSKFCINRYKDSLDKEYQRYIDTLYVAISEDNEVLCSTTPHVLSNAYRCFLIHRRSELAVSNWYTWYKVEYIDASGCVTDGILGKGFRLTSTYSGNYLDQRLNLLHDTDINNSQLIFSFSVPFEKKMQKVWDLYLRVKKANSQAELDLMVDILDKEEQIVELENNIADLNFTNRFLEKQRKQYKKLLDEIREIVKGR
jgi:hypothetical protein